MIEKFLSQVDGGIIVSCQAVPGDPTFGEEFMVAFALSAKRGGAVGIRANSHGDVKAIKEATGLPVIGIWKRPALDEHLYPHIITPTIEDASLLKDAGSDVIAIDATDRPRPNNLEAAELIKRIKNELQVPIMADCSCLSDALRAQDSGADILATTLAFPEDLGLYEPNLTFLKELIQAADVPVIAEGRYWRPEDITKAFDLGVHSIVVGSAITRPWLITKRYVSVSRAALTK